MGSKLHLDLKAEQEANEIAAQFMDSQDVVGDMSRTYGADFSSVRIHTDENAAQRVAPTGADAFSTGRDIFFGRGAFDQSDPASRGLLAHELAHTMQQGIGGGEQSVTQSAPEGEAQGGILDWFRGLFGKKKKPEPEPEPEMEISDPVLQTGPFTKQMLNDNGDIATRTFQNTRSYGIHQMLQGATREQLQDPALRRLVLEDYNTNMNARLRGMNALPKDEMDAHAFRRGAGELSSFNMMLSALLPEDFSTQVMSAQKEGGMDAALDFVNQSVSNNEDLMSFLAGANASFEGVDNYANPEDRSAMMMNNLFLRGVNSAIGSRIGKEQRAKASELQAQGIRDQNRIDEEVRRSVDISDIARAGKLQKALNTGTSESAGRLRNLLTNLFGRRG